jgi:hypothetical protein
MLVIVLVAFLPDSLEERVKRIQPGMTEPEVEEVIGIAPGDYSRSLRVKIQRAGSVGGTFGDDWQVSWYWDDATITVWFNPSGQVIRSEYRAHPLSIWDRVSVWFE